MSLGEEAKPQFVHFHKKTTDPHLRSINFDHEGQSKDSPTTTATGLSMKSQDLLVELLHSVFFTWFIQCAPLIKSADLIKWSKACTKKCFDFSLQAVMSSHVHLAGDFVGPFCNFLLCHKKIQLKIFENPATLATAKEVV